MSVCKFCGYIGGYHAYGCASQYSEPQFVTVRTNNTTVPAPAPTRIEYFGRLQVHQPAPKPRKTP